MSGALCLLGGIAGIVFGLAWWGERRERQRIHRHVAQMLDEWNRVTGGWWDDHSEAARRFDRGEDET